ncbi:isoliquiritigenin 2'-O-methyltransferase-like [Prosopis cineraria]|uniref:isoliquiritigenin 2'-O-methyltransferase-like n=1 Tax=Prosopis cineraria TaxID=364024 RepID=UPI00240F1DAB|nr:isoliquiritigenin 2'-O-methyltransferase-like [Prosopis cineraria]
MKSLSNGQDGLEEGEYDACLRAMILSAGQVNAAVLNAALELNLYDVISESKGSEDGFVSPTEIASRLTSHKSQSNTVAVAGRLDRMLRLLVAHSILTCSVRSTDDDDDTTQRLYGISPAGQYFVSKQDDASWASLMPSISYHPHMSHVFLNLKEAVLKLKEGEDLSKIVHGKSVYEYMETDSALKSKFQRTMADQSAMHMDKILQTYKGFEGLSTLVDVAGGTGYSLNMIISNYPSILGINFDLPHVLRDAPAYPGIKHVGGDMFKSVPRGDAIMIKGTTHNWSDEKCIQIFRNCHEALKKGGKVIVIDLIMEEEPQISNAAKNVSILDLVMFSQGGGRERTEKQFQALCFKSGFSRFRLASRVLSILGVMEFYKD